MVPMFLSIYLNSEGYRVSDIGFILTIYSLSGLGGGLLGGYISDKINPYVVACTCIILSAITLILLFFIKNFIVLCLLIFFFGLADFSFRPAFSLLLSSKSTKSNRVLVFGLRNTVMNISIGIAAIIGAQLLSLNVKYIFLFDGLMNIAVIIVLGVHYNCFSEQTKERLVKEDKENENSNQHHRNALLGYLCILMVNVIVFSQLRTTYPLQLTTHIALNANQISYLFFLNTLIVIFLEVPLIAFCKNLNSKLVITIGSFLLCCSFGGFAIFSSAFFTFSSIVLFTLGEILFFPTHLNLILDLPIQKQGKIMGLYQTVFSVGTFIGTPIGFYLYSFKNGQFLWFFCILMSFFTFLLMIISKYKENERARLCEVTNLSLIES